MDNANRFGIKIALFTFIIINFIAIGYFFIDENIFEILGFVIFFLAAILNMIVIFIVIINLWIRMNRLKESVFTLYAMLLNIPLITLFKYIDTF